MRVKSSRLNTKASRKKAGRPHTTKEDILAVFLRHYEAYQEGKLNVSELARVCELSRPTANIFVW